MSDSNPMTYPTYPQPAPAPVRPSRRPSKRLLAILATIVVLLALGSVTAVAVRQHGKAEDARAHAAKVADQRDEARSTLKTTQANLSSTQTDLTKMTEDRDGYDAWLDECFVAMKAARQMTDSVYPLFEAIDADIFTATTKMQAANRHLKAANRVIDNNGYDTIWELYDSCDLEGDLGA